jgi:hypothetical protein
MRKTLKKNKRIWGTKLMKRLIGQILVDGEFVSRQDLERALEQQLHTNESLGEILVRMGVLDHGDLQAALSISRELSSPEKAMKLSAGIRENLGDLLLMAKRITPLQLEQTLDEQHKTGEKLGEIFIRNGLLTRNELNTVLEFQHLQDDKTPSRLRLGEILVATGQISRGQLEDSLAQQRLSQKKIGAILVEAGHLNPQQLSHGLNLQKKLLIAALTALMSLVPFTGALSADPASENPDTKSTRTTITEEIQRLTSLKVLLQTQELVITQADILRGYIEINSAEHIEIQNNNLSGYLLVFDGLNGLFEEVIVKGLGDEITINSDGGWVAQPYNGRDPVIIELSYKFILSDKARPGTYTWPLILYASPIIQV